MTVLRTYDHTPALLYVGAPLADMSVSACKCIHHVFDADLDKSQQQVNLRQHRPASQRNSHVAQRR